MNKSIPLIIILIFILSSKLTLANKNPISKNNFNFTIPKILSATDKKIYLEINKLQSSGNWDESYKKIKLLNNKILLGYLEYDKLMHPNKYRASYNELSNWLHTYTDFPVVMQRRVYSLMIKRNNTQQNSNETLKKPKYGSYLRGYGENRKYHASFGKDKNTRKYFNIPKNVSDLIVMQKFNELSKYYKSNKSLQADIVYFLRKDADKKFYNGFIKEALETYKFLDNQTKNKLPEYFFKAGLSAFKLNDMKQAKKYFTKCNNVISNLSNKYFPNLRATCFYWTAKVTSSEKMRKEFYLKASKLDRTMYGQLAIEKLNKKEKFVWEKTKIEKITYQNSNILSLNIFHRLIALSELNFYGKADLEMRNLYSKLNRKNAKLLLYLSEKLDLAAVQIRLADTFYKKDDVLYIRGMYPTPEWPLADDFLFDRAFIYALIRRESAFNLKAKSSKGARGLMQLMPRTASKIKKDYRLRYGNKHQLYSLDLNLELGQKLLKELVENPSTKNQVLNTLIAYNAGITRVKKWNKTINENDPLAFIESIPIKETRMFVKAILTDFWIYRDKLGQNKPTRTMLANNKWPVFSYQDFKIVRDAKLR